jgi:hypothetical protein
MTRLITGAVVFALFAMAVFGFGAALDTENPLWLLLCVPFCVIVS